MRLLSRTNRHAARGSPGPPPRAKAALSRNDNQTAATANARSGDITAQCILYRAPGVCDSVQHYRDCQRYAIGYFQRVRIIQ